ncbi:MAG TPA: single-stranded-DNA-specific exonuclease RecJ [Candidatus Moranbacteria bacterium]|nr:single-stranded-DNA-specific exonuclease RecJ [Candidatus Moranbacteria bacterium]HAT75169.1 single-stranded-DNA-specific exonuclease RecJ [Candidatus Moranbacteria bacterium]
MQKKWELKENGDKPAFLKSGEYNSLILKLLANRGISTQEAVENFFSFDYFISPNLFKISGISEAAERIILAGERKEKIAIFGDYDADGVTATALIFETLESLGFNNLTYYIPDRQLEGYGMNEKALEFLQKDGVKLIITVDSGITNAPEIKKAKDLGIDVIVTDHHHIPEILPEAVAIINPHLENSGFEFSDLAGVGVAFKLAQALYQKIQPEKIDQLKWMLDLVAIGTVADCVKLLGENRMFVKYGLVVLSKTRRAGLQEMFKVGRIEISENNIPDTQKIAFQIAPRINAAGRMDHASVSYKLIIEKDKAQARLMALEVESKNQERQKITAEIVKEIEKIVARDFSDKKFIFVQNPHWPVGILGLVAGKVADKFGKPVVIFQAQETEYVGSLRSIPEINIVEVLEKCSELLSKFGGHSQAAGVRIAPENVGQFCEKMTEIIEMELRGKEIISTLMIDLEIKVEEITWEFIDDLKKMEPFGMGNKEPVFLLKNMKVVDARMVGNGSKHLKLALKSIDGNPKIFDAIGFKMGEEFPDLKKDDLIDIAFNLSKDEWNGSKKIQMKLVDMKIAG